MKTPISGSTVAKTPLQLKITLWTGAALLLALSFMIAYSAITDRNEAIAAAEKEALAIAEAQAVKVENRIEPALVAANTLADSFSVVKAPRNPIQLTREQVNGMLKKVAEENPTFLGTWTIWEPNAFDGRDAEYVNAPLHDETGRLATYWVRTDPQTVQGVVIVDYETPGLNDWYAIPRETKKEIVLLPYFYPVDGVDVMMTSLAAPIVVNDRFYGVAGVDYKVDFLQELVDEINLYDGAAEALLFTEDGNLVVVRNQPEMPLQSATAVYADFDSIQARLKEGEAFTRQSPDGRYLQVFSPIEFGNTGVRWYVGVNVPYEKITQQATSNALGEVYIGAALLLAAMVALWLFAGQVVKPVKALTQTANMIAEGNLDVSVNVKSNDEIGVLAADFQIMANRLRDLVSSLEQRVAERTKALSSVAEISTAASSNLEADRLLKQVTDLAKDRFDLYHVHIYLLDEKGDSLVLASGAGEVGDRMVAKGHAIPRSQEQSLVARVARTKHPVIVNDVRRDSGWQPNPLLPNTASELAVPMMVGDQLIGVLDVQSERAGVFTDADINILSTLGAQVAVAVQNLNQFETTIQTAAELSGFKGAVSEAAIIAVTDVTGKILEVNDNLVRISKYSREELLGQDHRILNSGYHPKEFIRDLWVTIANGKIWRGEIRNKAKDGSIYWVDTTIAPILNEHGKPIRYVAVRFDITQRKKLELTEQARAQRLEKLDTITRSIQGAITIESALQIAARELGHALGMKPTAVKIEPEKLEAQPKDDRK